MFAGLCPIYIIRWNIANWAWVIPKQTPYVSQKYLGATFLFFIYFLLLLLFLLLLSLLPGFCNKTNILMRNNSLRLMAIILLLLLLLLVHVYKGYENIFNINVTPFERNAELILACPLCIFFFFCQLHLKKCGFQYVKT